MVDRGPGWWTASGSADLLAARLKRSNPPSLITVESLEQKFHTFKTIYLQLVELLRTKDRNVDVIDALTYPPLSQTLDEYDDFQYDLQREDTSFQRRKLASSTIPYKVTRYVYTDGDITQLEKKLDLQITIMQEKMNHITLMRFIEVYKRSNARRGSIHNTTTVLPIPVIQPASTNWLNFQDNQEAEDIDLQNGDMTQNGNVIHLAARIERLDNRLKRTSPHVQSQRDANQAPPRLNPEEIDDVTEQIKALFQKNNVEWDFTQSADMEKFADYYDERFKRSLAAFPMFATRKRVYQSDKTAVNALRHSGDFQYQMIRSEKSATLKLNNLQKIPLVLQTVDIWTHQGQRYIVSTAGKGAIGILHRLPRTVNIHPSTNHRRVDPSTHDTQVSLDEECVVELVGPLESYKRATRPLYNFPLKEDMLAFQSAIKNKLLWYTFDVDRIQSGEGYLTALQHLKIWSDFEDKNTHISFYAQPEQGKGKYLEFDIGHFAPKPAPNAGNPKAVRLYFNLPTKPPKRRSTSASSGASGVNRRISQMFSRLKPNARATNEVGGVLTAAQQGSSTPPQLHGRFSFSHRDTISSRSPSMDEPSYHARAPSESSSIDHLSATDTAVSPMSSASTAEPEARRVHANANKLEHLDITFTDVENAQLFLQTFPALSGEERKSIIFRSDSISQRSETPWLTAGLSSGSILESVPQSPVGLGIGNGVQLPLVSEPLPFNSSDTDARPTVTGESGHQLCSEDDREIIPSGLHGTIDESSGYSLTRPLAAKSPRRWRYEDFRVGIICALPVERAAVEGMLDEEYCRLTKKENDTNDYTFGLMEQHNVVITCLPAGDMGNGPAAIVTTNMQRSFRIEFVLLVGIGGGVWSDRHDVRLGDVVVSQPDGSHGGVVQWDYGKTEQHGEFQRKGLLNKPPSILLAALSAIETKYFRHDNRVLNLVIAMMQKCPQMYPEFKYQGTENDRLFKSSYEHRGGDSCENCSREELVERPSRRDTRPKIHYGNIGSGNTVMKHAVTRDEIAKRENIICFEMEAAGLMNNFHCLVIRGICDYADSHKNKVWQPYAAATAAAFAKELLSMIDKEQVVKGRL